MPTYPHIRALLDNAMTNSVPETIFRDVFPGNDRLESIRGSRRVFISEDEQVPAHYWNAGIFRPMTYRDLARAISLLPDTSYWNLSIVEMEVIRLFHFLSESFLKQQGKEYPECDMEKEDAVIYCKRLAQNEAETIAVERSGAFGLSMEKQPVACFGLALSHGKTESGVYFRFADISLSPADIGRFTPKITHMSRLTSVSNALLDDKDGMRDFVDITKNAMERYFHITPAEPSLSLSPR